MLAAAKAHLSSRGQPDTLTAHFEYPSATSAGPAIIVIEDVKLGRQLSRLHLTLWQGGLLSQAPWINPSTSRRTVLAYATHTNLNTVEGLTIPTGYEADPANDLPPLPDFERLKTSGGDDKWEKVKLPKSAVHLHSLKRWDFCVPRGGPLTPGVLDMWIRLSSGERITQGTLAYVVDSFPHNLNTFQVSPEVRKLLLSQPEERPNETSASDHHASMWFPTLALSMEVKKLLPEEGVEFLAVRVGCKLMKDGIFDLDVLVRDVEGEIVALSHQVAMIMIGERKTKSVL